MGSLNLKLRNASGRDGYKCILHWCPGCDEVHGIRIAGAGPNWEYNNDPDNPTFSPSIRVFNPAHKTKDGVDVPEKTTCHYFITNGLISFCGDCPHPLANQTVPIPDWPYAPGTYGGIDE